MECKKAISLIHEYFDGVLPHSKQGQLKLHLEGCLGCKARFAELEKTEALLFNASSTELELSSEQSTQQVMSAAFASIPSYKQRASQWLRFVKRRPALTAAILFICVMTVSFFALLETDQQLVIKGDHTDQLIIEGRTVIVPYGKTVHGNLTVKNGEIHVEGQIEGDLIVIDGSVQQASTANITGEIKPVNEMIDRIWYTIGSWFTD